MKKFDLFFNLILLPLDYLAVFLAFVIAYFSRDYLNQAFIMPWEKYLPLAAALSLIWLLSFAAVKLYSLEPKGDRFEEFLNILLGASAALTLTSFVIFFLKNIEFSRLILLFTWLLSILFVLSAHYLAGFFKAFLARRGLGIKNVLLVGPAHKIHLILEGFKAEKSPNQKLIGFLGPHKEKLSGLRYLGQISEIGSILNQSTVDEIILAESKSLKSEEIDQIVTLSEERGLILKFVPDLYQSSVAKVASYNLAGVPVIEVRATTVEGWFVVVKRLMDILVSVGALIVTSPLLLLAALVIKLDSPGMIIFQHERVGKNGKKFNLYKFRSMHMIKKEGKWVHAEKDEVIERLKEQQKNYKLEFDPRVTRVGVFIRKTSIDELPQFFNVLKGEMSVVGPRAYIDKELDRQQEEFPQTRELVRRLLTVKPGITGIWQVSGRSQIEFQERVAMDAYYATNANFWMDLKITLQTIPVVLRGSGAM